MQYFSCEHMKLYAAVLSYVKEFVTKNCGIVLLCLTNIMVMLIVGFNIMMEN